MVRIIKQIKTRIYFLTQQGTSYIVQFLWIIKKELPSCALKKELVIKNFILIFMIEEHGISD